ncbi:hypothetical protein COT51_00905 [candidate division WWE3 bacterium CG08_land_8_20_14_0_20_41_15]|uniref:Nucleotidyl transferase AbiEii/AbiGii toxin family protein n=1 Tax=candidate division WWE3 bacterium CG08_land_8_20_14_0_20_41_15 TaxID=1975086 RepID=A0A2H0XA24_UNCKA|nr:MAG: hypothetical protein COT51_00905 [candidate division WWE3 bacterium CG08_land_8_20_14_0_20_41_15]
MSKLHFELLDEKRKEVFLKLKEFRNVGLLGGGTAIALQIGHRKSFDFDVLSNAPIKKDLLRKVSSAFSSHKVEVLIDSMEELTVILDSEVKITFLFYPFKPLHKEVTTDSLSLLNLKDLVSNKAYAIGRRGTWRDYVDVYFLIKAGISLEKVIEEAEIRFDGNFSEKLFLEQLTYFGDIKDFTIDFADKEISSEEIMNFLGSEVKGLL